MNLEGLSDYDKGKLHGKKELINQLKADMLDVLNRDRKSGPDVGAADLMSDFLYLLKKLDEEY